MVTKEIVEHTNRRQFLIKQSIENLTKQIETESRYILKKIHNKNIPQRVDNLI